MTSSTLIRLHRLIALLSLGIKKALSERLITIDEAERLLFSPGTMQILTGLGVTPELIHLIHCGTELDNIERLVPDRLVTALDHIDHVAIEILSTTIASDPELDNWLVQFCRSEV